MINLLKRYGKKVDIHTVDVIKKSYAAIIVKVLGLVAALLVSITLGRVIGPDGLGIVNLSHRITELLLLICTLGLENVILKEVAISYLKNDWGRLNSVVSTAFKLSGSVSIFLIVIFLVISPYLISQIFKEPELKWPFIISILAMIPQVYSRILAAAVNGCGKVWQSNLVNSTLSIWIVGFGILILMLCNIEITVINVALLYAIGRILVSIVINRYWRSVKHDTSLTSFIPKPLLRIALPLLLIQAAGILSMNIDTIMIGWLTDARQVGLYSVAARLALLTIFFLQISNSAISPKLAALYASGQLQEMKKMTQHVTKILIGLAVISFLFFLVLGNNIILFWGSEFSESYIILIILSIGQFFNISTGSTGYLLMMTGNEKTLGKISILFLFLNITMNYFLISYFGAKGAACATSITIIGENICRVYFAYKKVGILTIPIENLLPRFK